MDLRAKREAYHEAEMDSRLGWNSCISAKKGRGYFHALRVRIADPPLLMLHLHRLANLRRRPGYAAPAFANCSAVAVEICCTFSERKRSSAAILPTLSNSGSSFT